MNCTTTNQPETVSGNQNAAKAECTCPIGAIDSACPVFIRSEKFKAEAEKHVFVAWFGRMVLASHERR